MERRSFCWMCARWDSTVRTLEEELLADLGVGVAERDQPQDLDLALGEVVRRPGSGRRRGGDPRAEPRVEVGRPPAARADGLDELGVRGLLEHVAAAPACSASRANAGSSCIVSTTTRVSGDGSRNIGDRVEARRARHVEVEHEHVGPVRAHLARSASATSPASATTSKPSSASSSIRRPPRTTRVVVGDHDLDAGLERVVGVGRDGAWRSGGRCVPGGHVRLLAVGRPVSRRPTALGSGPATVTRT